MLRRILFTLFLTGISLFFSVNLAFAQDSTQFTVLPTDIEVENMTEQNCLDFIKDLEEEYEDGLERIIVEKEGDSDMILGCAVKSGYIRFWMVPYFVRNVLQLIISLAGLISVLMIIVGAYYYIAGGISDDKEKGKTIITYAIGGLILTTLAWVIVNVVLLAVTS